jgi:Bacterial Ig-like domain (group 2)
MKKVVALAVIGLVFLGLLYEFRHRIELFRPRIRFRTLEAINISPSSSSMPKGSRKKFTAIAHYRDGSQAELVSEVTWTSSNPAVAPIDAEGIATAANEGTSTLQATFQHAGATTTVLVVPVSPVAIAISPADPASGVNGNSQFKVLASRSDDRVEDVTDQMNWTASNSVVAKIAASGLAHGQAQGGSTIGADLMTSPGEIQTATHLTAVSTTSSLAGTYSYRYDNTGTGQNRFETLLTGRNVNAAAFGKLFPAPVDRYVYAQPLFVRDVAVVGQSTHNVVYVATENDTIFAIDADTGAELFRSNLGPAVPKDQLPCPDMGPQIGITGTPAIAQVTHTFYLAAETFSSGSTFFDLHAIDLASGKEKDGSPVLITATLPGTGTRKRNGAVTFAAVPQLQQPGLVLTNGQVIIAFGSLRDRGAFHGWVVAYDASSLKRTGVFLTTPNGSHGGNWQAGGTPVVELQGNLYVITGDGEFDAYDGGAEYGDTFLKLRFAGNDAILPMDYFTPFDQKEVDVENVDLGARGPMILPDQLGQHSHVLFGARKNGGMYLIDRDETGHFQSSGNNQIVQHIPHVFPAKIHVRAAYSRDSTSAWIYVRPVEGTLQAFPLSPGRLSPTSSSQTPTVFGYPRALPVISSNGDSDGIVWALENYNGVLHAFDATNLSTSFTMQNRGPTVALSPKMAFSFTRRWWRTERCILARADTSTDTACSIDRDDRKNEYCS